MNTTHMHTVLMLVTCYFKVEVVGALYTSFYIEIDHRALILEEHTIFRI